RGRPLSLQHDDRSGNGEVVGKADVHVTNAQSTRPLGRRAIEPQLRTPAFPIDHLDLLKGQTLGPSSSEGLETCLLGGEPGSERPRAFRATGAGRTLFLSEDLFFELTALGQRSRDALDRDDVHPDARITSSVFDDISARHDAGTPDPPRRGL